MSKLNAKPEALDLDLKRTAIVIVDMQNAFASKGECLISMDSIYPVRQLL